jgi:3-methyladenine DNA glycosylase AlkD
MVQKKCTTCGETSYHPRQKSQSAELVKFVANGLRAQADPNKAVEMAAYMKTEMPFYGVQKPQRLPIYKAMKQQFAPLDTAAYESNILALWKQPHREEKYAALEYAVSFPQFITADCLPLYEQLVREGAWWDFVDVIAQHLVGPVLLKQRAKAKPVIECFVKDEDMWIRRTALLAHNHHKKHTDEQQLFKHCLLLAHEKEFFIRKAIGWALREYSYVAPDRVRRFVKTNEDRLSPLSCREALKRL